MEDWSRNHALSLDEADPLRHLREEFIFPSKANVHSRSLPRPLQIADQEGDPSLYLCGNSLGLQPKRAIVRIQEYLSQWATKGVNGHFIELGDHAPPPFLHADMAAAARLAPFVGADASEVAVMETLTANLHLLMSSFYTPTQDRYKIVMESKAFPSDHYAVQSQIVHRGFDPASAMITIEPRPGTMVLTTEQIKSEIDKHAATTALILLPGIQYYTGQLLDIPAITAHAHSKGLLIGWDLAHATGNVELKLHEWDVDFAAWCNYKYLNSGPGAIASLFVHEKHGKVEKDVKSGQLSFRPRLSGWWGGDKGIRFNMGPDFVPIPGAAGFQVGNATALGVAPLLASLEVYEQTSMAELRSKSKKVTAYLEKLLLHSEEPQNKLPYHIITPTDPEERGAQLSVQLEPGMLDSVMKDLESNGVIVDERKPDVIRVAPVPLYNGFTDCWDFVQIFQAACEKARQN